MSNSFNSKSVLNVGKNTFTIYRLDALKKAGFAIDRLPFSIRILLENLLRKEDGKNVKREDIEALAKWDSKKPSDKEIAFTPARVLLQDFTGVPTVVDLAVMRDWIKKMGGDPKKINPLEPADLVIDHSVQVDYFGSPAAFQENAKKEFSRNQERYQFLKWGQRAFQNFRVVPPNTGIVHQVNLEYLAPVVFTKKCHSEPFTCHSEPFVCHSERSEESQGKLREESMIQRPFANAQGDIWETFAYPDTLIGTDSHTTMINGLGVLGWGVGGIEAEAAMLGQPISMLIPEVVGFKLTGKLSKGVTATDLVLTVTQMLRKKGAVGKFVEFFGPGLDSLSLADRATVANMCPEYGATVGFFPVDSETLRYLELSGRSKEQVELVKTYLKEQGLFRTNDTPDPVFSDSLELDLKNVEPSLAGPKRPQDRVRLGDAGRSFKEALPTLVKNKPDANGSAAVVADGSAAVVADGSAAVVADGSAAVVADEKRVAVEMNGKRFELQNGSVVIAAITSCTNTSNPSVMIGAGLLAKKAVERGLETKPWVKTSLAPGSKVVMDYLGETGLKTYLEQLGFYLVGYGCTTCIGNSGPLPEAVEKAIRGNHLVAVSVLSGNRNFEGRIHPSVRANYLASPPLVVAFALVGTIETDLTKEPIGKDKLGKPVYLRDLWPTVDEIKSYLAKIQAKMFEKQYSNVFEGDQNWKSIHIPAGDTFAWDPKSTYIKKPPYFDSMPLKPPPLKDIQNARVLAVLGDSVTTDHISPAGSIAKDGPAGKYLIANSVSPEDFNSYGARRGNHEVMVRGTFANIRLKNLLVPNVEGGVTRHLPDGEQLSIFDASVKYKQENVPLIVIAGKEYGAGSSRDWAAKGPALLGVKAVIAESFERIHRSNLIGMGILPLEFKEGENRESLRLTGEEVYSLSGISDKLAAGKMIQVSAGGKKFTARARIDTPVELAYYQHGGILQYVLRQLIA